MNNQNNPDTPQQMPPHLSMPMMPPPPMPRQRMRNTWQQRLLGNSNARPMTLRQERTIPNWLIGQSVIVFFVAMFACWGAFGYVPDMDLILISCISAVLFLYGGDSMLKSWSRVGEKQFIRNVFIAGVVVRLVWVLYMYYFFNPAHFGNTYGDSADVDWYIPFGKDLATWIGNGFDVSLDQMRSKWNSTIDDIGYPIWLGFIYLITGVENDIFVPLLVKCIVGAYCAISIYQITKRHYGEGAARIAAIFVALNPNMIYWCGTMMKESEMVFLVCLAVDNFDRVLSSGRQYTFKSLLPGILAALVLFLFRTAVGLVMFLAVFAHIVMASTRVMSAGKKIIAGVLVGAVLMVAVGDRIQMQSQEMIKKVRSDTQKTNMEWRSNIKDVGGRQQSFAKYAGAAVFAPLIFTIPFPTFNSAHAGQLTQMQLAGGSYIKNIFSFFVIMVMIMMLISGEWRKHVFIIAYTVGYLMVLVMSNFAQSGRFHMPVWPMLMLFAAYGIQVAKTNPRMKRWFPIVLVIEVVACLAWNWFKLKGRGMV